MCVCDRQEYIYIPSIKYVWSTNTYVCVLSLNLTKKIFEKKKIIFKKNNKYVCVLSLNLTKKNLNDFFSFNITKNVFLKNNKCVCVCVLYFNLSKNNFLCIKICVV